MPVGSDRPFEITDNSFLVEEAFNQEAGRFLTLIAEALRITLTPQEQAELAAKPTENLQAYDWLLRAMGAASRNANSSALRA